MKRSVLMKLTACCMTGAMVLGSTGVVTMASGLDSALAGMGAEIAGSQQQKEVVKVAPTGYDTVAIAQVDEYVNIRDAASTEGNVVGKLYNNCKAEILGKTDDGWYLIQSGEVTGYVSSDYFVTGSQAEALAQEVGTDMATVKDGTETLMVRSSADSNSEAISMVGDSEKLRVLEDDGDWVKVAVDDDVEGYVSKEYVDCDTEFVEAESVEQAEARKAAVQEALDKATQMQEAAYAAMNAADGNEAAYAADQANAALAEAKMLASEQEYDYEIQDLTDQIAYVAQDTSVASVWAQEAQAEEERIAAEEAARAAAEAQAAAEAVEAKKQELRDSRVNDTAYVVHCARIECPFGMRESYLALDATHGVLTHQIPQMTVKDMILNTNIINFGGCHSRENPDVQAEIEKTNAIIESKKDWRDDVVGYFTKKWNERVTIIKAGIGLAKKLLGMKKKEKTEEEKLEEMSSDFVGECKAQFPADGEWLEGHEKVFINGEPLLLRRCSIMCSYGGCVTILLSGQPE